LALGSKGGQSEHGKLPLIGTWQQRWSVLFHLLRFQFSLSQVQALLSSSSSSSSSLYHFVVNLCGHRLTDMKQRSKHLQEVLLLLTLALYGVFFYVLFLGFLFLGNVVEGKLAEK
jgi:hypothetical protein